MWINPFHFTDLLTQETKMEPNLDKHLQMNITCSETDLKSLQGNRKRKYFNEESPFCAEWQGDCAVVDTNEDSIQVSSRPENTSHPKENGCGAAHRNEVAIVPSRYPSRTFSKQEANALLVQLAMGLNSKSAGHPRFVKHQFYCGAIVVSCLDEYSKNWLLQRTEECSPWEKTPLRNCETTELERSFKIEICISDPIPAPDVSMKWLANQNPDLDTSRWLILEEKEHPSKRHFVFKVPESSFRTVKKNQMMLFHGFDVVDVKCLGEMKDV